MTKTAKDLLARLQMKYGNQPLWSRIAREELLLPDSHITRADMREKYINGEIADLGLYQRYKSKRAPWFVNLEKLAEYMDKCQRGKFVA